jgi:molybdenum cofactor guanylyltransferase
MIFSNFTGYILSGGKSSRMGADKAFLEIGGKTFLENAVGILQPICSQVKIVLNPSQKHFIEKIEKLPDEISYVFDVYENRGAVGGIHAALKDCETEFAVVLAVDLPRVTSEAIENLAKTALIKNAVAVVPRQTDGRLQPLAAVYRVKNCLPEIEKLLNGNASASARDFLERIPAFYVAQSEITNDADLFLNVNFPADFQNLP